ncbi:DUF6090 family protein [Gaetbulibacter aestuarii]|uniref:DUF6090 family protein n=1 Tax=Gaetbulibacter aestuarii TaxID=1502358 RepID=A0ABW7MV88_9FLAO
MIKLFHNIRKQLLEQDKISNYLKYAIGEIILVVFGILIALQINNWNQNRIEQETLWGYLNNISINIENDLKQASDLNFINEQLANNTQHFWRLRSKKDFTFTDYKATEDYLNILFNLESFEPNTSGFETLKTTGYLGKLQGTDIETLLLTYYESAAQVSKWENKGRTFLDNLLMENNKTNWGFSYEALFNLGRDSTAFTEIKDNYQKMLNAPTYDAAVVSHGYNNFLPSKLKLHFIGKSILDLINQHKLQASDQVMRSVALYKTDFSDIGQEEVVINGIIPKSVHILTDSNKGFDKLKFEGHENYLEFHINPNLNWAAAMFVVDSLGFNNRPSKDFTAYKKIQVELKGKTGGEKLELALKDKYDPDDGTESRVPLTLSKDWQTYTFDLQKDFPKANLKHLYQLAGFVVQDPKGMTLKIKNIQFLKE